VAAAEAVAIVGLFGAMSAVADIDPLALEVGSGGSALQGLVRVLEEEAAAGSDDGADKVATLSNPMSVRCAHDIRFWIRFLT